MASIGHPLQVQAHIVKKFKLGWSDSNACVVNDTTLDNHEDYRAVNDESLFEIG